MHELLCRIKLVMNVAIVVMSLSCAVGLRCESSSSKKYREDCRNILGKNFGGERIMAMRVDRLQCNSVLSVGYLSFPFMCHYFVII